MIKTLQNTLKQDKERFTVPKSVQDIIPIRRIWPDGVFQFGSKYSKTLRFSDINYAIASKEDKTAMFLSYSELLNALDTGSTTKITINNKRLDRRNFEQEILIPPKGDDLDGGRKEYNAMLLDKVTDSSNSVVQERYITLSVHKKNVEEAREMLDDLTTRDQRMMFAVVTLVHLADSKEELDSDTETLQSIARKHLCQLTTLNWQQADGLVTALPLGLRRIDALRTLTTEALAVLMPFKAQEIWDRGGVYYGQNAISKNLIVADRRQLLNGNAFILGVSGSGKSFSAKKEMVSLALSTQDDIIVIDPESEYRPLIEGLGGQVINISATSPNHINAMDMEQGYGDGENPVVLKSEFLLSLCEQLIGAGKLSAKEKSVIDRCTAQVYRDYIRSGYHGAVPTLQDFHAELLRQPEKEAQDVALAIELFTDGSLNTFAKPTNVDTNARILCYDIRDLGKQLLPVGMLVVLDSIFNRIIRNRGLKRNTWIYIDEIYLLFQHEYSANFLFTLWKRMRKYQACGTGISQNIEDLLQSHTARTMLANSEFLIMLNQAATDREELAHLLNISDNQLSYITNVDSGRGLIKCGSAIVPFVDSFPRHTRLYQMMTTRPSDLIA